MTARPAGIILRLPAFEAIMPERCRTWRTVLLCLAILLLAACAGTRKHANAPGHAQDTVVADQGEAVAPPVDGIVNDPWEGWNRGVHRFNNAVDRAFAKPLARGYAYVVPRPVRTGIGNVFSNLGQPVSALNALLQGRPKRAGQSLARFALNLTLGVGGLFDPASAAELPKGNEDFGQTLAVWGWKHSRYFELPFFGPRTVRDSFGLGGDLAAVPLRRIHDRPVRYALAGLSMVDTRAQLLTMDRMREGFPDDYALVRDTWLQRRHYLIFGDELQSEQRLPDYLLDEDFDEEAPLPEKGE